MISLDTYKHVWRPGETGRVLLLFHGTGGDENDLVEIGRSVLPGASILSAKGNVDEGGYARWFRRLSEGVFDMDDLRKRTEEIAGWVATAKAHYGVSDAPVAALGYSNGANILVNMLLQGFAIADDSVLLRPMLTDEPKSSLDLHGKRVLLNAGRFDTLCPPGHSDELSRQLESAGAECILNPLETGHNLVQEDITSAKAFFENR